MVGFWNTAKREVMRMGSRKMYLFGMVAVPLMVFFFFTGMLSEGLPLKVPVAVVDMDHSSMSRRLTRNLNATELLDITQHLESYDDAMASIRRGEVFGFFVIPSDFEKDALAGKSPTLSYFDNLTYFVPGTLAFKGFKTIAVGAAQGVVSSKLQAVGVTGDAASSLTMPITYQEHCIGNPWMNYNYYLSPSFCFGALALMIMLMSVFAMTMEIKNGTSPQWLGAARGHIGVAVAAKMLPHFIVWSVIGQFMLALFFGFHHFPCGHIGLMSIGMELYILGNMCMGYIFSSIVPNPRFALILAALTGILSFSFLGFSFPVQNMYGAIAIFSYIMPTRYMFLIYITNGLNDFPLYYSRIYFAALFVYPLVMMLLMPRLKKACLKPVYVP